MALFLLNLVTDLGCITLSLSIVFTTIPQNIPETKAATGRNIAKTGPSIPYVRKILSIPVCGVETRKEVVAPLEAP